MKPAIRSPRLREGRIHLGRIGLPTRNPAADIAERMGGMQQVHRGGTGRQFLFPDRNLVIPDRRRQQDDERLALPRKLFCLLIVRLAGARVFLSQAPIGAAKRTPLAGSCRRSTNRHGVELSVVGHAHRNLEDLIAARRRTGRARPFRAGGPDRRVLSSDSAEERSLSIGRSSRDADGVQQSRFTCEFASLGCAACCLEQLGERICEWNEAHGAVE